MLGGARIAEAAPAHRDPRLARLRLYARVGNHAPVEVDDVGSEEITVLNSRVE